MWPVPPNADCFPLGHEHVSGGSSHATQLVYVFGGTGGDDRLFFDAAGRQQVQVRALVGAVAEVVDLDQPRFDEGPQAVIDAAKAYSQFPGDPALTGVRLRVEELENAIAVLVAQHWKAIRN